MKKLFVIFYKSAIAEKKNDIPLSTNVDCYVSLLENKMNFNLGWVECLSLLTIK